jgi:Ca2+-transporting ATPase
MGEKKVDGNLLDKPWYFLGLIVYADPVRKGIKSQFVKTKRAGIGLKVITGDYRETALQVMKQLGIKLEDEEVMDGSELEQISEIELDQKIEQVRLFARTSPSHKLKIVEALQRNGEVVAMTGDGVNDAPALKKADIGIVVSTASDVSKETADMVLLNDDFSTIVAAVEEGRGIFANLRKVLLYLLSDSFSEVILVVGSLVLGLPLPITAAQILWVNLANDGLPNLALTVDPKEEGLLSKKPRRPEEPIVDKQMAVLIGLVSVVTGTLVLLGYMWYLSMGVGVDKARTVAFAMLGVDSLFYVFSCRSLHKPIWKDVPWKNPWLLGAVGMGLMIQLAAIYLPILQRMLHTVALEVSDWGVILAFSVVVVMTIELTKVIFAKKTDWLGYR